MPYSVACVAAGYEGDQSYPAHGERSEDWSTVFGLLLEIYDVRHII